MHCGKQKSKIPLPGLLSNVFLHLPFVKTPRSVTVLDCYVLERLDHSTLRGHVASVSPTFN